METTRIEMHFSGINAVLQATDNEARFSYQHRHAFPIQGTLHCTSVLDSNDERVTRVYARTMTELKSKAKEAARRLFHKNG